MFNSLCDGVLGGFANFLDTGINFRYQKSERIINAFLHYLQESHQLQRNELILGSKGGFLHEDADFGFGYEEIIKELQ